MKRQVHVVLNVVVEVEADTDDEALNKAKQVQFKVEGGDLVEVEFSDGTVDEI